MQDEEEFVKLTSDSDKPEYDDSIVKLREAATAAKDWRKVCGANRTLSSIAENQKDLDNARTFLEAALAACDSGNLKEERKEIRRKLDSLA